MVKNFAAQGQSFMAFMVNLPNLAEKWAA